MRETEIEVL